MANPDLIRNRLTELIKHFQPSLASYDSDPPFTTTQRDFHLKTVAIRRRHKSAAQAADDPEFCLSLYATLQAWGIGQRDSILVPIEAFCRDLSARKDDFAKFDDLLIDNPTLPIHQTASDLWLLITSMQIVENKAKLVSGSKALHHLLPNLIVPIDRQYTRRFFGLVRPEFQGQYGSQRPIFMDIFTEFARIARAVPLVSSLERPNCPWRTGRTKLIDNALIGFCRERNLPMPS